MRLTRLVLPAVALLASLAGPALADGLAARGSDRYTRERATARYDRAQATQRYDRGDVYRGSDRYRATASLRYDRGYDRHYYDRGYRYDRGGYVGPRYRSDYYVRPHYDYGHSYRHAPRYYAPRSSFDFGYSRYGSRGGFFFGFGRSYGGHGGGYRYCR